jgi:signal transduction histidine kinase
MTGMRSIIALLVTIVVATFAAGYFSLSYRLRPKETPDYSEIVRTRKTFMETHASSEKIDLDSIILRSKRSDLLSPSSHLPTLSKYPYSEITKLYRYSQTCEDDAKLPQNKDLQKAWMWHSYLCGKQIQLPKNFFETRPWIHPSGSSYAFMAYNSGRSPFLNIDWLSRYRPYMHILEWSEVQALPLTLPEKVIASLDRASLQALYESAPIVLSQDWALFQTAGSTPTVGPTETLYAVYPRNTLNDYLKSTPILVEEYRPNQSCILREGNSCWNYNLDKLYSKARRPTLALTLATLILAGIVTWLLIETLRKQRLEAQRTRFALQTLTHELRTPVSDLVLSSEVLRPEFDRLTDRGQDAFLRTLNDIQRLLRLTEESKKYLGAPSHKIIQPHVETVPSLRDFVLEIAEQIGLEIVWDDHSYDAGIEQDPYWLALCLRNLLQNAAVHGKPPIQVFAEANNKQLRISICDQGECEFKNLNDAVAPFQRGKTSQGLGLGLSIVQETIQQIGGKLEFKYNPTTFILEFPFHNAAQESIKS